MKLVLYMWLSMHKYIYLIQSYHVGVISLMSMSKVIPNMESRICQD